MALHCGTRLSVTHARVSDWSNHCVYKTVCSNTGGFIERGRVSAPWPEKLGVLTRPRSPGQNSCGSARAPKYTSTIPCEPLAFAGCSLDVFLTRISVSLE